MPLTNTHFGTPGKAGIPVAARPKAWVCGRSLPETAGFESRRRHACLSPVSVVRCQVEVSATGRSLVQRFPTTCVLLSVIGCNNNPLHLQRVGRKRSD